MGRILDLLFLSTAGLPEFARRAPATFLGVVALAALSAALSWALLAHSALLWNKRFASRARRHPFCALGALSTFLAIPLVLGAPYARPLVDRSIRNWARDTLGAPQWQEVAFDRASEGVRRRRIEPLLPPVEARCLVLTTAAAREAVADAYSAAALESFAKGHRLLASLLDLSPTVAATALSADMRDWFDRSSGLYPASRIESVLAETLSATVDRRWEGIVRKMQTLTLLLPLLLHLSAFGIVGWAGYREIRIGHGSGER